MVLPDDAEEKWVYRQHTKAKHEVLTKYIVPWVNKITTFAKRASPDVRVRIFDCFAGRGSYVDTDEGAC